MAPRIGILGARGIGYAHAIQYNRLGARVTAILCSSKFSAQSIGKVYHENFQKPVSCHYKISEFLDQELDAVSICSPEDLHFEQILQCFDRNIPVFCEKPLFWHKNISLNTVNSQLLLIKKHENRFLFVNTSNTHFIDLIKNRNVNYANCKRFSLEFDTLGKFQGMDIASDLLPHGLSMIIEMFGACKITSFKSNVIKNRYTCNFNYGIHSIYFDLRENPSGSRRMRIGLDDDFFSRIQVGEGDTYKVLLFDERLNEKINCEDPFQIYISNFLKIIGSVEVPIKDGFDVAALNLQLMADILCSSR